MENLSLQAQSVIEKYLKLPLGVGVRTPYFNNRRKRIRAALRALVGKGLPEEIVEEAEMFAIKDRVSLKKLSEEGLSKFLVDHDLGIDCSGFVYHVLEAESLARNGKKIRNSVKPWSGIRRKIVHLFRPVENSGVSTFSNNQNSFVVSESEIRPSDFISIIGMEKLRNHIMLVEKIEKKDGQKIIHYIHSIAYSEDGVYNTGVRRGYIMVKDGQNFLDGVWSEEVLKKAAKSAKETTIRRLNIFK